MFKHSLKIAVKSVFLILLEMARWALSSPVITNNLAMTQMQNSDELYLIISMYEKYTPVMRAAFIAIAMCLAVSIGHDIYTLTKTNFNKKEN